MVAATVVSRDSSMIDGELAHGAIDATEARIERREQSNADAIATALGQR